MGASPPSAGFTNHFAPGVVGPVDARFVDRPVDAPDPTAEAPLVTPDMSSHRAQAYDVDDHHSSRSEAPHAPGALVWGLATQVRHPRVLGLFLASGLAVAASAFGFTGAGGVTAPGSPLAVPFAVLAVVTWTIAYRYVDVHIDADGRFRPVHLRTAARQLPDLFLLYATILGLVYASWHLSVQVFAGHYSQHFAFFGATAFVLVNTVLATPALLIGDAPSLGSLYSAWKLSRGIRATLAGVWLISGVVAFFHYYLLWRLVASYSPARALVLFGVVAGVFVGGFHLGLVRLYRNAPASTVA